MTDHTEYTGNTAPENLITDAVLHDLTPAEAADVSLLTVVLADPAVWAAPGIALEDAVVRAVLHSETADNSVASVTPLRPGTPGITRVKPARIVAEPPRRFRALFAIAAAIAAIAITGGVLAARRDSGADFKGNLAATALIPRARASAEMYHSNAGFRVELEAHGLPTLTGPEYYQGWLKNEAGTAVPIGTFSSSNGKVTLWAGVSPKEFRTFSVSIESTTEAHVPSGRGVLVGAMRDA